MPSATPPTSSLDPAPAPELPHPAAGTGPAVARIQSSAIRDLLALTEQPGIISLAGGKPAPDTFPVAAVRAATDAVLSRDGAAALQYSATEGYRPLREWVAERRGVPVDRVTITSGSQQGLDLVARAVLAPGDLVACADPGYIGAVQAFRLAGAELVGLPSDGEGLRVDILAEQLAAGLRPRIVYVIPELSNPTGATLSADRREALADLADCYGFWLVEDDPYGALRWRGVAPPPLADHTGQIGPRLGMEDGRLVSLSTVSKVLSPGLRVGHVVAPVGFTEPVVRVKQVADLHTPTLTQRIVHELVSRPGFLDEHLAGLPVRYQERADALTAALRKHLGDELSFHEPDGGMFIWAQLKLTDPDPDDRLAGTTRLLELALEAGVAFVPGNVFRVSQNHEDRLRLSFATPSPAELTEGARRLATAIDRLQRSS